MSLSAQKPKLKFFLDENVKRELLAFLKSKGYDVAFKPKGLSNSELASFSKSEQRVLVTNDADFAEMTKDEVFSIIWLKVPQEEPEALLEAFSKLLETRKEFEGYLIVLTKEKSEAFPLPIKYTFS